MPGRVVSGLRNFSSIFSVAEFSARKVCDLPLYKRMHFDDDTSYSSGKHLPTNWQVEWDDSSQEYFVVDNYTDGASVTKAKCFKNRDYDASYRSHCLSRYFPGGSPARNYSKGSVVFFATSPTVSGAKCAYGVKSTNYSPSINEYSGSAVVEFNSSGIFSGGSNLGSWTADRWYEIRFDFDCSTGKYDLWINGTSQGQFNLGYSPTALDRVTVYTQDDAVCYIHEVYFARL